MLLHFPPVGEEDKWHCYVCNPKPLNKLITECNGILESIEESKRRKKEAREKRDVGRDIEPLSGAQLAMKMNGKGKGKTSTPKSSSNRFSKGSHGMVPEEMHLSPILNMKGTSMGNFARVPPRKPSSVPRPFMPTDFSEFDITPNNVAPVLDRLVAATQSMNMLLSSLADDLKVSKQVSMGQLDTYKIQNEVSKKLKRAMVAYKKLFRDIENYAKGTQAVRSSPAQAQRHMPQHPVRSGGPMAPYNRQVPRNVGQKMQSTGEQPNQPRNSKQDHGGVPPKNQPAGTAAKDEYITLISSDEDEASQKGSRGSKSTKAKQDKSSPTEANEAQQESSSKPKTESPSEEAPNAKENPAIDPGGSNIGKNEDDKDNVGEEVKDSGVNILSETASTVKEESIVTDPTLEMDDSTTLPKQKNKQIETEQTLLATGEQVKEDGGEPLCADPKCQDDRRDDEEMEVDAKEPSLNHDTEHPKTCDTKAEPGGLENGGGNSDRLEVNGHGKAAEEPVVMTNGEVDHLDDEDEDLDAAGQFIQLDGPRIDQPIEETTRADSPSPDLPSPDKNIEDFDQGDFVKVYKAALDAEMACESQESQGEEEEDNEMPPSPIVHSDIDSDADDNVDAKIYTKKPKAPKGEAKGKSGKSVAASRTVKEDAEPKKDEKVQRGESSRRTRADIEAQRLLHRELLEHSTDSEKSNQSDNADSDSDSDSEEEKSGGNSTASEYNPKPELKQRKKDKLTRSEEAKKKNVSKFAGLKKKREKLREKEVEKEKKKRREKGEQQVATTECTNLITKKLKPCTCLAVNSTTSFRRQRAE